MKLIKKKKKKEKNSEKTGKNVSIETIDMRNALHSMIQTCSNLILKLLKSNFQSLIAKCIDTLSKVDLTRIIGIVSNISIEKEIYISI